MSVRWEIVGEKEVADFKVLGNRLSVVASHTWRKVLRSFNSPRGRLNGQTGYGDWCAGPPRIGVQYLVMNDDGLRRVGSQHRRSRGNYGDDLENGNELPKLQSNLLQLAFGNRYVLDHGH